MEASLANLAIYFIIITLVVARLTRLVVADSFPPIQWARDKWDDLTVRRSPSGVVKTLPDGTPDYSPWNELLHCAYCMSFWVSLVTVPLTGWVAFGAGVFASVFGVVAVLCVVLAVAYIAAIIVASDWG